ncbi:hypothetical protein SNEBB_004242 [Seison nebaliae]|nr:hypothetical protein SNEBB_004242 [Seison nebaliae]
MGNDNNYELEPSRKRGVEIIEDNEKELRMEIGQSIKSNIDTNQWARQRSICVLLSNEILSDYPDKLSSHELKKFKKHESEFRKNVYKYCEEKLKERMKNKNELIAFMLDHYEGNFNLNDEHSITLDKRRKKIEKNIEKYFHRIIKKKLSGNPESSELKGHIRIEIPQPKTIVQQPLSAMMKGSNVTDVEKRMIVVREYVKPIANHALWIMLVGIIITSVVIAFLLFLIIYVVCRAKVFYSTHKNEYDMSKVNHYHH